MAETTAFDTLATARRLEAAGINKDHAEAIAESQATAARTEIASKANIDSLQAKIQANIADRDNRLAWRLFALVGLIIAAFAAGTAFLGLQ